MKKTIKYIASLLLLLVLTTSCQDNENWKISTDLQEGTYLIGDATIYSSAATSSLFKPADLDNAPKDTDVKNIYTWLKAGKEFKIIMVDAAGNKVTYGKGTAVDNGGTTFETTALVADGPGYTVAADGLYNLVLNSLDKQISVVPVKIGIIGDATPKGWDAETVMTPDFKSTASATSVEFTLKSQELANKGMKFRYANAWGIEIPYGKGKVKFHSNLGLVNGSIAISSALADLKGGGDNFSIGQAALYDITVVFNLRSGVASAKAVKVGDVVKTATLPVKMFINGSPFSADWSWAKAGEMINVNGHEGWFWGMYYFDANAQLKFNSAMAWNGNDFGSADEKVANGYGDVPAGTKNVLIKTAGFYQVVVKCSLSADKQSVINIISLLEPAIYLCGDAAPSGTWGTNAAADKFTLDSAAGIYSSPAFAKAGNVRIYAAVAGAEWWQTEFNIFDGAIKFRGAGGDQPAVVGVIGQKAMLNFVEGTGAIQ